MKPDAGDWLGDAELNIHTARLSLASGDFRLGLENAMALAYCLGAASELKMNKDQQSAFKWMRKSRDALVKILASKISPRK